MKKTLFCALASIAVLSACSQPGAYVINGSSDSLNDGDTVFVVRYKGRVAERLDSTVVSGGQFTFKGVMETPQICNFAVSGKKLSGQFFLEEGTLSATIDSHSYKVTGTANNDTYNAAQDILTPIREKQNEILKKYYAPEATQEQKIELEKEYDSLDEQYTCAVKDIVADNISNAVGIFYLKTNYYNYDVEELYNLVQSIPDETIANDARLVKIKDGAEKKYATRAGEKFIDFTLADPQGAKISLSDYAGKGKYVLVDFWASWCGPCCAEMPNVVELYAKYKNSGLFEIVGVSLDDNAENWVKALEKYNMTWPQMSDLKGWECAGAGLYGVNGIPHTVLIDPQGVILERDLRGAKLSEKLAEIFK